MGANTKIEWALNSDGTRGATFNPWTGCSKVGPGCDHCYAEAWAKRAGFDVWGPHKPRRRTTAANWREPIKWNREAGERGIRIRVFGGSLCDPFDNAAPAEWRADYWKTIKATPNLDWIIVTKRAGNIAKMLPADWGDGYANVWLVLTVCTQAEADRDIPRFLGVPAAVHGLSMEPLLEDIDFSDIWFWHPSLGMHVKVLDLLGWIIVGGLSGSDECPLHPDRVRSVLYQCQAAGVAFFFKQWGEWEPCKAADAGWIDPSTDINPACMKRAGKKAAGRLLDGREWNEMPESGS